MAGVTLQSLSKAFPGSRTRDPAVAAVRDLDLEVEDGEFLVLVGASGSGKSTVLRMIAGLETPSAGRILIGDRDVTDVEPRDRDVAMVFQNYALYPHMSVRQNLAFGLSMRKTPRAEIRSRVDLIARKLDIEDLLDRKPAALSGGQRQRVALGRAIVRQPRVFLFDEPLSNLDARLRVQTRGQLVRLHRELGTTMIYVTHDQTEAMTMGQRIALLHQGRLQQLASPLELYDRPANRLVAGFIGSPPMNFFSGRLEAGDPPPTRFVGASFHLDVEASTPRPGVILGIRPEHLRIADPGHTDSLCNASVLVVEPLGSETFVLARTPPGEEVAIRIPARTRLAPDQTIGLLPDTAHIHLFDAGTGNRLP